MWGGGGTSEVREGLGIEASLEIAPVSGSLKIQ